MPEAQFIFNKFHLVRQIGRGPSWREIDEMEYLDYQILIICIDAYSTRQARVGVRNEHYRKSGVVQAGSMLL